MIAAGAGAPPPRSAAGLVDVAPLVSDAPAARWGDIGGRTCVMHFAGVSSYSDESITRRRVSAATSSDLLQRFDVGVVACCAFDWRRGRGADRRS